MGHHRRPDVELDQAQAPRQPLAKEKIIAVVEDRASEELAAVGLLFPDDPCRQTVLTNLARRVLHRAAVAAFLQLEAPERRRGGEAERGAAARRRRQRRQPGAQYWVLTFLPFPQRLLLLSP